MSFNDTSCKLQVNTTPRSKLNGREIDACPEAVIIITTMLPVLLLLMMMHTMDAGHKVLSSN